MRSMRERAFWDVPGARSSGLVDSSLRCLIFKAEVGRIRGARMAARHEVQFMAF